MKYYLYIIGCAMNQADAERLSSLLAGIGLKRTDNEKDAKVLVAVSCSVRQSAVNRIYAKGEDWKKRENVITALSGCVLKKDQKKLKEKFDFIFPIEKMGDFVNDLGLKLSCLNFKAPKNAKPFNADYLSIKPKEISFRAYVPIMTGCNNFCSYCAVPYVRGREKSRPEEDVLNEVRTLVKGGVKEITLLGQNVNSYGVKTKNQKPKTKFVELIKKIDKIPGDYRVYFYSNHPKDVSESLIKALPKLKHFPNYLHLPLQSGNNEILRKMNRSYTQKDYLDLVLRIKKQIPDVNITTDIMVGFPTETEAQFKYTVKVMKKVGFGMAFVARYSPRPETASFKMEDNVLAGEKKRREEVLQKELSESMLKANNKLVGKRIRVLVDGHKNGKYYGRSDSYKVVEILDTDLLKQAKRVGETKGIKSISKDYRQKIKIGEFYYVLIEKAEPWKLIATLA